MESPVSSAKAKFACVRCSERKVGCDKQNPCNACIRYNVQCIFRPPKPPRRKRKFVRDGLVDERLKRCEALLKERGIDPDQVLRTPETERRCQGSCSEVPETAWKLSSKAAIFKTQLQHGQGCTALVDNSLWSRVAEEIHDTKDALEEDSANDVSDDGSPSEDFAFVLDCKTPITTSSHPPARLIHQLWQAFIENVNPLTKLLHVPSLQLAIEKAIANIEHVPKGFEALMFAIYSMAVLSLTEEECKEMSGEARAILLPRYMAATKAALSRAKFMSSTSIVVLQALVLHIFSIRDTYEPRAVWNLTGVAIRISEGMGMQLDGVLLDLPPFETEIRRRIWWQLRMHDFRTAELCGQAKFRAFDLDETKPKKPANINDGDLYPTMPQAAAESTKPTEMIWCMLRFELASFAATQKARVYKLGKSVFMSDECAVMDMDNLKVKDVFIKEIEDRIETKYLRFCDPSQPLHLMALLGGRSTTNMVTFMAHHPRTWANLERVPVSEQQLVWNTVIHLLEQYNMMQSSPQLRHFAWIVPYFIQWHAVIHTLDTLRANPLHVDAVKAWRLIDALYENNLEMLLSVKKPIFLAVGNLCLKAFSARAAALKEERGSLSGPPEYITRLREQREAAKARREAVIARSTGQKALDSERRWPTTATSTACPDIDPRSVAALVETQPQQYPLVRQPVNPVQGSARTGDDAFWLSDALDNDFFAGEAAGMMNLDTDAILAQDYWPDTPEGEATDWARWDAWVGKTDRVRPNIGTGHGEVRPG